MAETVIDKNLVKERLEKYLSTHEIKVAKTFEDLLGPETEQTQEEIRAEVDKFLGLLKEWRKDTNERGIN